MEHHGLNHDPSESTHLDASRSNLHTNYKAKDQHDFA